MKRVTLSLPLLALAALLVACSGFTADAGPTASTDPNALHIAAKDLRFSTDTLTAPAGKPISIVFDNQESAPHNVAIYKDSSASEKVFAEDPFGGPKTVTYSVPPLAAGTYFFRCDVHTSMTGSLEVK